MRVEWRQCGERAGEAAEVGREGPGDRGQEFCGWSWEAMCGPQSRGTRGSDERPWSAGGPGRGKGTELSLPDGTACGPDATPCVPPAASSRLSDTHPAGPLRGRGEWRVSWRGEWGLRAHLLNPRASVSAGTAEGKQRSDVSGSPSVPRKAPWVGLRGFANPEVHTEVPGQGPPFTCPLNRIHRPLPNTLPEA